MEKGLKSLQVCTTYHHYSTSPFVKSCAKFREGLRQTPLRLILISNSLCHTAEKLEVSPTDYLGKNNEI